MSTVRVRYAPSPTGHLHIGGVRTALFNYFFARHHGGKFILRFEDTDLERNVPGAEEEMLRGFTWLGIDWDEGPNVGGAYGPYRCTERLETYTTFLHRLAESGHAYPCFCSEELLAAEREEQTAQGLVPRYSGRCSNLTAAERDAKVAAGLTPNWRFAVPKGVELKFHDLVREDMSFQSDDIGDFVIVKSNGIPTYHFQVVVDDALMEISHVIRGEEHLSNTPKHLLIFQALGVTAPTFAHLPQVLDQSRKKLSKRDPSVKPVHWYRERGYLPEGLVNFLALLGWSPGGEEEIMSIDEIVQRFDLERVNRSGAVFDVDKLQWMAAQYTKKLPIGELTALVAEQLRQAQVTHPGDTDDTWLGALVALYQDRMSCAGDFVDLAEAFFVRDLQWDEESLAVLRQPGASAVVARYRELAAADEVWTPDSSRSRFKQVQQELGVKGQGLFMPVRAGVMGQIHGPDLQQTIALLPKEWVLTRLANVLEII
ncbi:MAG: glutamate--tRNA ligase [Alicyclobacillus sp. RIFOXYA1_FULL_53_8]|nr:MAG: glutamate--tRNA ligase [Alicyclobacillus sp. RIFOXYA1_FULL_53_8]